MIFIRLVLAIFACFYTSYAIACAGANNITAINPANISLEERAYVSYLKPIRVVSVNAPPLSDYYEKNNAYRGIAADILCYLSKVTGVQFEYIINNDTLGEKIAAVQNGSADMFMPISYTDARAKHGIYTQPFYDSYYAVLSLSKSPIEIHKLNQLKGYTVGVVGSVALEPVLRDMVPGNQIKLYESSEGENGLFQALRNGEIDLALYNKDIFNEKRFRAELLDIEAIYTITGFPRQYRFYFHDSPENKYIVNLFNRVLSTIDISYSVQAHQYGEKRLIERYIQQRNQRSLLQIGSIVIGILAVIFAIALFKYMHLIKLLEKRNTKIMKQQAELELISLTDSLTGLANRRMFDQTIVKEHARLERNKSPLCLLMIDIDDFKNINDTFGHNTGDDYLRSVAKILSQNVKRKTDLVARYGGEEFMCVLPDTSLNAAQKIAERISFAVMNQNLANPGISTAVMTVSIGVACLNSFDYPIKDFINAVDEQLYIAKRSGKNQFASIQL